MPRLCNSPRIRDARRMPLALIARAACAACGPEPAAAGEIQVDGWNVISRSCAPAGAQQSISYKPFDHRVLWTASAHYDPSGSWLHNVNTVAQSPATAGWQDTWHSCAGHLGSEFWYGRVVGHHWAEDGDWIHPLSVTEARDCNLGARVSPGASMTPPAPIATEPSAPACEWPAAVASLPAAPADALSPLLPLAHPLPDADPRLGVPRGKVTVLSIDDLPAWLRADALRQLCDDAAGFECVPAVVLSDATQAIARLPRQPVAAGVGDSPGLLPLRSTPLANWTFLGRLPGLELDGRTVIAARAFDHDRGALPTLEEFHYLRSPGAAIVRIGELANARVGSHPARPWIQRAPDGDAATRLHWVTDRAAYTLVLHDDVDHPHRPQWSREWLLELAASLRT